ncbi:MAG: Outer membrane adhesin like protein [Parcubacteria group bacterium GW2011_GWA2_43_13]|nr:MAG: Outer membrane adhesin like protein [Parcubacteria group bacterium GW2011_GWA2_43_13]HAZ17126.1 hypothetical protein [Candidatus Jacksonbacteria bacterium]
MPMKREQLQSTRKAWSAIRVHSFTSGFYRGFSLVEVILSSAVFVLLITALVGAYLYGQEATVFAGNRARSVMLAEEGLEAVRNIRDAGFSNLTGGIFGLIISDNQWDLSGSSDVSDIFTRQLVISAVDTGRIHATSNVTWQQNPQRNGEVSLITRFSDWARNFGNWGVATQEATLDLSTTDNGNEIALYTTGSATYAIVVRTRGLASELYVIDVSIPASPVVVSNVEIGATVNDVAVCGNYAVVATVANSGELQVINLTTPSAPLIASVFNLTGGANALSVVCTGTTVFLGRAASAQYELYAITIADPLAPSILSSLELGTNADAAKVVLAQNGQYLYIASPVNSGELFIVSTSSPSSIFLTSTFDASGGSDGTAVTAFSTYAVLGRADGNILVIDVSIPAGPTLISSALDIGGNIQDMAMGIGDSSVFIASNTADTPTFIIDVITPASPAILGSVAYGEDTKGIVWDYNLNRAFIAGTSNTAEFAVLTSN